jgi:hypothetical protein
VGKTGDAFLRRHNLLDADDHLIESIAGEFVMMTLDGVEHPMPKGQLIVKIQHPFRSCYCSYSSRRLFFGLPATVGGATLQSVWRVETSSTTLTAVFGAAKLQMVRWKALQLNAGEVTALGARILAQRDLRIAELPPEARQEVGDWSVHLDRRGALEALLAGPAPEPRTIIGAWLRALLRGEKEKSQELASRLGEKRGRDDDQLAVIRAAFDQLVRRYFGAGPDTATVTAYMSRLALAKEREPRIDLPQFEGMIRSALAGALPAFSTRRELQAGVTLSVLMCKELDLYPAAIDWLAVRSEQLAFDQGRNPPLLAD